jgi:hypothetical protein
MVKFRKTYTVVEEGKVSRPDLVKHAMEVFELNEREVSKKTVDQLLIMYFSHNADEPGEFLYSGCEGKVKFEVERL